MDSAASHRVILSLVVFGLLHCSYESKNIFKEPEKLRAVLMDAMMNETWVKSMMEEERVEQAALRKLGAFPCPALAPSNSTPTSVHALRPSDINVVAAIGDSYSTSRAGGGVRPFNMLFDYRGNAWSSGGDKDYDFQSSVPNILREHNEDLYGFGHGTGECQRNLNVADIGARSSDFVSQANTLVNTLRSDSNVDMEVDWKLITVFLGGNDLCNYCENDITPDVYLSNMRAGLDILFNNIPRAFVNLVLVMPVSLTQTLRDGLISDIVLRMACPCATFPESEEDNAVLANYTAAYNQGLLDIAASGDYDSDNFTVVAQRFYENITLPFIDGTDNIDYSFFAIDRFHISKRGNAVSGRSLWNSMFEPVGNKSTEVLWYDETIVCPSEDSPYLLTSQNSANASFSIDRRSFVKHC